MKRAMKSFMKEIVKMAVAIVLALVYGWFLLSFAWSLDDMSTGEKVAGVVYGFAMVPMYEAIKKIAGLR